MLVFWKYFFNLINAYVYIVKESKTVDFHNPKLTKKKNNKNVYIYIYISFFSYKQIKQLEIWNSRV